MTPSPEMVETSEKPTRVSFTATPDMLLVLPPLYHSGRPPDYNPKEPMGLMYLASSLRMDERRVNIFDADIESKTLHATADKILEQNPPIVGFSVFQRALPSFELIVRELREKGYRGHITCGGITPTLSYSYILERMGTKIDSIVLGEGENTARNLAERILNNQQWHDLPGIAYQSDTAQIVNKPIDQVDLDTLPFAARDCLSYCAGKTNYATIMGSRGCYGICSFCSNYTFENVHGGPRWRGRNPVSIVDEMQNLFESYGTSVFKFNDPNIFGPGQKGREHVKQMCEEILRRKLKFHLMGFCRGNDITSDPAIVPVLKAAGFERLLIGIESSSDEILGKFGKLETINKMEQALDFSNAAGISTVVGFMIFNPYTTINSLKSDLNFLERRGNLYPTLAKAMRIFDGTPIQDFMEKEGRLVRKNPFEGYHDYIMPRDIAAIYASMKVLFSSCLDRIRAVGQDRVWDIKKAPSFRDRQDFNSLAEAFFQVESSLLRDLISWTEDGNLSQEAVNAAVKSTYQKLCAVGRVLDVDVNQVTAPQTEVAREIYTLMREKPWDTFREEYRWNQD